MFKFENSLGPKKMLDPKNVSPKIVFGSKKEVDGNKIILGPTKFRVGCLPF